MREAPRDPQRLDHILQAIDNSFLFTSSKTKEDLAKDSVLFYAVVKNVEIIGEAAFMLTLEFKEKHKKTPWKRIVGFRHALVHGYYTIALDELWNVIQNDLQPLRAQVVEYLKEFEARGDSQAGK